MQLASPAADGEPAGQGAEPPMPSARIRPCSPGPASRTDLPGIGSELCSGSATCAR